MNTNIKRYEEDKRLNITHIRWNNELLITWYKEKMKQYKPKSANWYEYAHMVEMLEDELEDELWEE